jgi:predicted ATP-grasp superfamily ATP-dependent carboligase
MASPPERAALLVVRVWIEGDPAAGFRARLIRTRDVSGREEDVITVASVQQVLDAVRGWLEEVTHAGTTSLPVPRPAGDVGG